MTGLGNERVRPGPAWLAVPKKAMVLSVPAWLAWGRVKIARN